MTLSLNSLGVTNQMFIPANDWFHIGFRLILALLVGCLIGINRQKGGRPAGMRTFMLVSMGSALFVMLPLQAEGDSPSATNALSRTIQGVTTGVSFLGAGLILQQSSKKSELPKVRGLTTAASIWIAAALGAAIGCGFWQTGLVSAVLTLVTLSGVKRVQRTVLVRTPRLVKQATSKDTTISEPQQSQDGGD